LTGGNFVQGAAGGVTGGALAPHHPVAGSAIGGAIAGGSCKLEGEEEGPGDKGTTVDGVTGASTAAVTGGNFVQEAIGGVVGGALAPNYPVAGSIVGAAIGSGRKQ